MTERNEYGEPIAVDYSFTWHAYSWRNTRSLILQLTFSEELAVSMHDDVDIFSVKFIDPNLFLE